MISKVIEKILDDLRERKELCKDRLSSGSLKDMQEVNLVVGKFKGISESEDVILSTCRTMFNSFDIGITNRGNE